MQKSIFAQNLTAQRKILGWSQEQAASHLNVKKGTYAAWEESRSEPGINLLLTISEVFKIDDLYLFMKISNKFSLVD